MQTAKFLILLLLYAFDSLLAIVAFLYSIVLYAPYIFLSSKCARTTASSKASQTVVIIGYSFAGFEVHKLLQSHSALKHLQFIIIEPKSYFEFTPSILMSMVNPDKYKSISFPISACFDPTRSTLIQGKAISMEREAVCVQLVDTGETTRISFDFCFICTGSKYAEPIKVNASDTLTEQIAYNERMQTLQGIYSRLHSHSNQEEGEDGIRSVAIIGGGPVGVELMAELSDRFPDKQITIIDANQHLCRLFPRSTQRYLENYVHSHQNITLRLNTRIKQIISPCSSAQSSPSRESANRTTHKSILIISQNMDIEEEENENESVSTYQLRMQGNAEERDTKHKKANQETLEFDAVFKCAGFQPNSELLQNSQDESLRRSLTEKYKFIKVDEHMRVHAHVFALGDVIDQPRIDEIKLAHTAEIHARYLRDLMVFALANKDDASSFTDFIPYHEWLLGQAITERAGEVKTDDDEEEKKWKMPLVFSISLGETDGAMGFGRILLNGFISRLFKWFIEISLCKLYQRKGIFELNLCHRENDKQPIFRMYPAGYRIFAVLWWFNHLFTMWYIRHYNG